MGIARARRIAERVHRGRLFAGGLFVAHLDRVARLVEELSGSPIAVQGAWLHATPVAGVEPQELLRMGVPARVAQIVDLLRRRPSDYPSAAIDRILRDRRAALVQYAVLTDWHKQLAGDHRYEHWRKQHERLADALGMPRPAPPATTPADLDRLSALVATYRAGGGDQVPAVRAEIYRIATAPKNAGSGPVAELVEQWWESTDDWEQLVAVSAIARTRDPAYGASLLAKLDSDRPNVIGAAIEGLVGTGDPAEIEALRRIVSRPENTWRSARKAAAYRLVRIGGDDAEAALDQHALSPFAPPWRHDPGWLRRNGARIIPVLIEKLTDPQWLLEAPYALGELRAAEAVGPLCDAPAKVWHGIPLIEALGKIGSTDAVPTLLDRTHHPHHEVRDHALRALDRIGGQRVVDAALAACGDPHPVVRDRAARVLARHADRRAVPQLIRLCDTAHAAIAAEALARIGDPRAAPTLWRLFCEAPDRRTRHAAGRGLARMESPVRYLYGGDLHVRRAYLWLLGHKPELRQNQSLINALADPDPIARVRAAEALARRGDAANADRIHPLLDDPDPRVRATAATALGRLLAHRFRERLDQSRSDPHPDVRSAVAAALRRLG